MTFEEHAAECFPNECCGLIVNGRYRPCRNSATGPDMLDIHPEDWAAAEDEGPIEAICHSHPNGSNLPSALDLKMMDRSRKPWWILGREGLRKIAPVHSLLGREFEYGVHDCFKLATDYYRTCWGVEVPEFDHQEYGWWKHGKNLFLEQFEKAGFFEIPMEDLRIGDGILMQIESDPGNPVPNHCAVLVDDNLILHHMYKRLSTRDVYGDYFRKVSVRYLRNRQCLPK
jgi:proteasome lid subunit RPN8/RPN11